MASSSSSSDDSSSSSSDDSSSSSPRKNQHKDKHKHKHKHKRKSSDKKKRKRSMSPSREEQGGSQSAKSIKKEFDCAKCGGKFVANSGAAARPCTSSDGATLCDGGSKDKFDAWKASSTSKALGERSSKKKAAAPKSAGQTARLLKKMIAEKEALIAKLQEEVEEMQACVDGLSEPAEAD